MENNNTKLIQVSTKFIRDSFYHKGNKIVVLENTAFNPDIEEGILVLAKLIETETEQLIEPLTDAEYEDAAKKYEAIINLFKGDDHE